MNANEGIGLIILFFIAIIAAGEVGFYIFAIIVFYLFYKHLIKDITE